MKTTELKYIFIMCSSTSSLVNSSPILIAEMTTDRKEIFKLRFKEHYPRLCNIAYGYVADMDDSEDIVQDLFVTVWNNGKDSLPEKEFAAYITTAVKNCCVSFLRKKCKSTISIDDTPASGADIPDDEAFDSEAKSPEELLNEALDVLPPKCREIFLLSRREGLKYREIASTLGLSEKTVENQMTKAIKLLREFAAVHSFAMAVIIVIVLSIITSIGV